MNGLNDYQKRILLEYRQCGIKHVQDKFKIDQEQINKLLEPELKKKEVIKKYLSKRLSQYFDNYQGDPRTDLAEIYAEDWANGLMNEIR